uniref:Uncharacterized protein n=1 Tax=Anguilla anguilla TaxID=7936 RepID=A0A0E9WMP8_ANGAN
MWHKSAFICDRLLCIIMSLSCLSCALTVLLVHLVSVAFCCFGQWGTEIIP